MFTTLPLKESSTSSGLSGGSNVEVARLDIGRTDRGDAEQNKEDGSPQNNVFQFINSFRPEDTKSSSNRKAVRSQAARPQNARGMPTAAKVKRKYSRSRRNVTFNIQLNVNRDDNQKVLEHDLSEMAVDIPELDLEEGRGLLRSRWFPMAMSEAALLQVILLTSASHYAMLNSTTTCAPQLLQMRQEALAFINELLRDPDKHLSDQAIAAVAKMASYEAMYGSEEIYLIHMKGLQRMVRMRGGLAALGLDGLLARMLLWIDNNASFLINTPLHFASHQTEHGPPLAPPNPALFLGAS
ncbi:MAG: hypothetical protein M1831_000255 [Alyxoria varia]|nr:MAG: hypothetical protein M1831_000255 [Alyxoria varia]